jgi:hypothetical protein
MIVLGTKNAHLRYPDITRKKTNADAVPAFLCLLSRFYIASVTAIELMANRSMYYSLIV